MHQRRGRGAENASSRGSVGTGFICYYHCFDLCGNQCCISGIGETREQASFFSKEKGQAAENLEKRRME